MQMTSQSTRIRTGRRFACLAAGLLACLLQAQEAKVPAALLPGIATVYQPNGGYLGNRLGVKIYCDKKHVATVAPKRYTSFEIAPGEHELSVTPGHEAKTTLIAESGKSYYFSLTLPSVIFARIHLRQIVPEQGK